MAAAASIAGAADLECDLLVLGAGPGGYSAAFRAADLGLKVVIVERYATLGGVCLNVGCIPSKALLHVAAVMDEVAHLGDLGVDFGAPVVNIDKLRGHKDKVIGKLTGGLAAMAKMRKVTVVRGYGAFVGANHVEMEETSGSAQEKTGVKKVIAFKNCIIAAGSQAVRLPFMPDDLRVVDSTGALALKEVPKRMLTLGGGIIGLEMGTVYSTLGARALPEGIEVTFESAEPGGTAPAPQVCDLVLQAVGRTPNGKKIAADKAGVPVTDRGFIPVDIQMRTNVPHIFAIGDIVGQPMLAHKAVHEAHVAAEVTTHPKHTARFWAAEVALGSCTDVPPQKK